MDMLRRILPLPGTIPAHSVPILGPLPLCDLHKPEGVLLPVVELQPSVLGLVHPSRDPQGRQKPPSIPDLYRFCNGFRGKSAQLPIRGMVGRPEPQAYQQPHGLKVLSKLHLLPEPVDFRMLRQLRLYLDP